MKTTRKTIALAISSCFLLGSFSIFAGCTGNGEGGNNGGGPTATGNFSFTSEMLSEMENPAQDYNGNLFYVNSLEFELADPTVIYVTEGRDKGYFYAYGTSDEINCHGIQSWRSKDLSHWESMGVALLPDYANTWAVDNYWAPEVIFDATDGLYYMFYNAFNMKDNNRLCLSVAYSETPYGPFLSPTGRNARGEELSVSKPVYDVTVNNPEVRALHEQKQREGIERFAKAQALDASPFIDPVSGEKYLYFSYYDDYGEGSFTYGMKMIDWYTPDYSTMARLTYPFHSSVQHGQSGQPQDRSEGNVNEGPYTVYHDGKYYLTFSIFGYTDPEYKVIQAIADSPLGDFEKIAPEKGGKVISTDTVNWDHIVSAGHHCFITVGDELYIAYHTFKDRLSVAYGRALAVDKVIWTTNQDGTPVMHTNGPTWSVQPLPASLSGYKNIAGSAKVTANKTEGDSDVSFLTDGILKYQEYDLATEYEAKKGTSTITLQWDTWKTVRSVMIYNSYDYYKAFEKIDRLQMEYLKADGTAGTVTINNLPFDTEWFFDDEWEFIRPGGSSIAEFAEMPVRKITITVSSRDLSDTSAWEYDIEEGLALNEIIVLGKDSQCADVDKFEEYTYTNREYGSSHIITESDTFGTVLIDGKASSLATMYGYDLSHDDGTENAYIEQIGTWDQYCYFKDVYATEFYVEAEFTVTQSKSFANDQWPKFGIAMSCDEMLTNTIFYYIDADPSYSTSQRVGAAQRALDNSDWAWGENERLQSVPGISYSNGNTTKLAVLRQGATFYMLCNDKVVMTVNDFNVFTAQQRAAVGFLTFNTPMRVSKYFVTADSAKIAEKYAQYIGD